MDKSFIEILEEVSGKLAEMIEIMGGTSERSYTRRSMNQVIDDLVSIYKNELQITDDGVVTFTDQWGTIANDGTGWE